jgi:hypothetical protein
MDFSEEAAQQVADLAVDFPADPAVDFPAGLHPEVRTRTMYFNFRSDQ